MEEITDTDSHPADKNPREDSIIRSYVVGDEVAINEMFNEVFRQQRDLSHWYWKYRDNPAGAPIISLAYSSGVLAAHFAAYPLKSFFPLAKDDRSGEYTIYHAGDKMTRRRFRAAGFGKNALLTRTYLHFMNTGTQPDTIFKYGFMASHSLRFGLLFLNYTVIESVAYRTLAWKDVPGRQNPFVEKYLKGIKIEVASDIDETWSDFFYRNSSHYGALVKRDASYLKWRYLRRPDRKYLIVAAKKRSRLVGWSVFYRDGNRVIWGDALFGRDDLDCVRPLLSYVGAIPFSDGAEVLVGWFPSRPDWWDRALRLLAFEQSEEPNGLHFCIGNYTDSGMPGSVKGRFYYTLGDSDLF